MQLQTNLLLAGILMTGQLLHGQTAIFSSNFEDQNFDAEIGNAEFETGTSGGYEIVANPSPDSYNSSNYVMKVYTNPGTGGRAEYSVPRHATNEKIYIYKWKRFFPVGMWTDIQRWFSLQNQWKTWPCSSGLDVSDTVICEVGGGIFNDFSINVDMTGAYRSRAVPDCNYDFVEMEQGIWHDFTLEVYWTQSDSGYYRIWRNDKLFGYSDNIKTLFDEFKENRCDIYWTIGLYSGWAKAGGQTQDSLISYLDDVALYDVDNGFTIDSICPSCEVAPDVPTDSNVYKVNTHFSSGAPDGYNNYIVSWSGDTSAINISNTFGQSNGIDIYLWSDASSTSNVLSSDCFPKDVIQKAVQWSDTDTHEILFRDLNPNNTYKIKVLSAGGNNSSAGLQIWTNEKNRDTLKSQGNTCNMAVISNLKPDVNGDLSIYAKTIGGTAYINAIEIVEYLENHGNTNKNSDSQDVIVFPNPVKNNLYIMSDSTPSSITIYTLDGRQITSNQNTNTLNLSHLNQGIYIAVINLNGTLVTEKIIKE